MQAEIKSNQQFLLKKQPHRDQSPLFSNHQLNLHLRRPRPLVVEYDENEDEKSRQDRVLKEAAATRKQLIVE